MQTVKSIVNKALAGACALLLAFMTALAVYQVLARYLLQRPSTMSEDILSYSFVWLSLLGTALVFGERDHMRLSFFSDMVKGNMRLYLSVLTDLLILGVAVIVFLFGGRGFMQVGAIQVSPTLGITMDWVYAILPLSGVLIVAYCLLNIVEAVQNHSMAAKEEAQ